MNNVKTGALPALARQPEKRCIAAILDGLHDLSDNYQAHLQGRAPATPTRRFYDCEGRLSGFMQLRRGAR